MITIIHDPNRPHLLDLELALTHGIEKSLILTNIPSNVSLEHLYKFFPYIPRDKFVALIKELVEEKLIQVTEE